MRRKIIGAVVIAAALATAPAAVAEPAVGVIQSGSDDILVSFDTAAPSTIAGMVGVTGLVGSERLIAMDFNKATDRLIGLGRSGTTGHLYALRANGGAKVIPGAAIALPAAAYGFDVNSNADRAGLIGSDGSNRYLNLANSSVTSGTAITPAGQAVDGLAFDAQGFGSAAPQTAFAINPSSDDLQTIGGVGTGNAFLGGQLTTVGSLGVDVAAGPGLSADFRSGLNGLSFADDALYLLASAAGTPSFFSVNPVTGAASLLGAPIAGLTTFALAPVENLTLESDAPSISERGGSASFTIRRSGPATQARTVYWTAEDRTAGRDDYSPYPAAEGSGRVDFAAGASHANFTVKITDDLVRENDETFALSIGDGGFYDNPQTVQITIIDDDGPGVITPPIITPPIVTEVVTQVVTPGQDRVIEVPARRDELAPAITLTGIKPSYKLAAFKKGIAFKLAADENGSIDVSLNARVKKAMAARAVAGKYNLELAGRTLVNAGPHSVTLKPKAALLGKPKKPFKVELRIIATDPVGNARTTRQIFTIKP